VFPLSGNPPYAVFKRCTEKREKLQTTPTTPPRRETMTNLKQLWTEEEGVTALEYGLIAALIAVVIIAAVKAVGTKTSSTFNTVQQQMP
jgi:pilus assembly protein Flp/PilA